MWKFLSTSGHTAQTIGLDRNVKLDVEDSDAGSELRNTVRTTHEKCDSIICWSVLVAGRESFKRPLQQQVQHLRRN